LGESTLALFLNVPNKGGCYRTKAGRLLLNSGKTEEGRAYYWKAVNSMKMNGYDDKTIMEVIEEMNHRE